MCTSSRRLALCSNYSSDQVIDLELISIASTASNGGFPREHQMVDSHGAFFGRTWTPHGQKISHGHGQVHLKEVTSSTAATKKMDSMHRICLSIHPKCFLICRQYRTIWNDQLLRFCGKVLTFLPIRFVEAFPVEHGEFSVGVIIRKETNQIQRTEPTVNIHQHESTQINIEQP